LDAILNPAGLASQALSRGLAHDEFDGIVREHQQRVYRVILALVRDPDLAANLTQDCFVRAYENRASFRGDSSVYTWLTRIAINLVRDNARNRRQGFWRRILQRGPEEDHEEIAARAPDTRATAERLMLAREELAAVWREVETLSPQQREIFVLRFSEEMQLEEIAEVVGVKLGTVKAHLSRAVAAVREQVRGRAK
jgi:RNA polymerase sigma-70 factor (ECF subfamily)